MRKIFVFILNIPWTILGIIIFGILSLPKNITIDRNKKVIVLIVHRLWLNEIFLGRIVNGFAIRNVILLAKNFSDSIYNHELIHISQFKKIPLFFPLFYCMEFIKNGYYKNKYEIEAYEQNLEKSV